MLNAKKVQVINELIHIYYAAVVGSTVNNISLNFFRKSLLLEQAQVRRLVQNDVFKDYLEVKFEPFFRLWYLNKFSEINNGDKKVAKDILIEIFTLYKPIESAQNSIIKDFFHEK